MGNGGATNEPWRTDELMPRPSDQRVRIDRGQRIIREVAFEPDPALAAKVRFVKPLAHRLPPDEHSQASEIGLADSAPQTQDVAELSDSASVWEALEEDDKAS